MPSGDGGFRRGHCTVVNLERTDVQDEVEAVTSEYHESIHAHDVLAERYGTVGELRGELRDGEHAARHTELREWLAGS